MIINSVYMEQEKLTIVIYGAGAIGSTLAGWLFPHLNNLYLLARGDNAKIMKEKGLILYHGENNNPEPIPIKIIEDLGELSSIDIVIIAVKNYDLDEVSKNIIDKLGDKPIVVGLQNGMENQSILPKYFSKIVYCVIMFSAWKDEPGVFGYRDKGQLVIGTPNNENLELVEKVSLILKKVVSTKISKRFNDAIHSKMIINLLNSVFTLIDFNIEDPNKIPKLRDIFYSTLCEGIDIVTAAGFKEHRMYGPSWKGLQLALKIPLDKSIENFKDMLKYGKNNSMMQDIIVHQKKKSEIESLTGYFIQLANKYHLKIPYNQTIYEMAKIQFNKVPFKPLDVEIVWNEINKRKKEV